MRYLSLLLLLGLFTLSACNDDEAVDTSDNILNHDGPNATGPELDAGTYEFAVRFDQNDFDDVDGDELSAIQVFFGILPQNVRFLVSQDGANGQEPGDIIFDFDASTQVEAQQFNQVNLTQNIPLDQPLWLSVVVEHGQRQQSVGCDSGPRQTDGDWLYRSDDQAWRTYVDRTGESVNWNIRGVVE